MVQHLHEPDHMSSKPCHSSHFPLKTSPHPQDGLPTRPPPIPLPLLRRLLRLLLLLTPSLCSQAAPAACSTLPRSLHDHHPSPSSLHSSEAAPMTLFKITSHSTSSAPALLIMSSYIFFSSCNKQYDLPVCFVYSCLFLQGQAPLCSLMPPKL